MAIHNHKAPKLSTLDMQIMSHVPPGGNWRNVPKGLSKRIDKMTSGRSTQYGRLRPDCPSYTISTYYPRPGNGCHFHWSQERTISHREKAYKVIKSYEEVGSGMSDSRPKLRSMFDLVKNKEIDKVIMEHKDRLTKFNFQFFEDLFASHDVKIEWMEEVLGKRYEDELVEDMLTLMSSFSNKIYWKRSAENRKKKKLEKLALEGKAAVPVEAEVVNA